MLKTLSLETWWGLGVESELPNTGEFDLCVTYNSFAFKTPDFHILILVQNYCIYIYNSFAFKKADFHILILVQNYCIYIFLIFAVIKHHSEWGVW